MKVKVDQLIFFSIILHIISTQSVLTYLFFDLFGIWEVKSALHPITFILIIISFTLKIRSLKVKKEDLLVLMYLTILALLMLYSVNDFFSLYISVREVFFIFILTFLLSQFSFTITQYNVLKNILVIFILSGILLTTLNYIMGAEKFMTMLVGYYDFGKDEITKFKISHFMGYYWRSPGAVGSSGSTAYFALLSYYILDLKPKQGFLKFLAFALLLSTFTRSAILCLIIYELLKFLNNRKNLMLIQKYSYILIGLSIIMFALILQTDLLSLISLFDRIEVWFTELSVEYNLLLGGNIGEVGGAIRGEGPEAVLDSYWLFLLYSTGLVGLAVWVIFFFEKAKISKRKFFFVIGIIFSGFFVHLTQAIPFLVMFPIIFSNFDAIVYHSSSSANKVDSKTVA